MQDDRLPAGVARVRADNPSPLTLDGTNTYLVEGWVVDPGPDDARHLDAIVAAAEPRGIGGIVLTHSHVDHSEGAPRLARRAGVEVTKLRDGERAGPLEAIATPGHSPDHVSLLHEGVLFSGDTVLGTGSVFISPGEGSLSAYLDSLRRLRELDLEAILPGHGPVVWDPRGKLDEYVEHRLERERRIVAAFDAGASTRDEVLDRAWDDVDFETQPWLRYAAGWTLDAHVEKLVEDGRLDESPWKIEPGPGG